MSIINNYFKIPVKLFPSFHLGTAKDPEMIKKNAITGLLFFVLLFIVIQIRLQLIHYETNDFITYLSKWYDFIKLHGGISALKQNFSDYTPPYLYLLIVATYLPLHKLIAIKCISIFFDFMLAFFVGLIVREKYSKLTIAIFAGFIVLLLPTVFLDSSLWAQSDSIYATFIIASFYFILKEKWIAVFSFFGIALAFKLQAIFFLPVLTIFLLKKPHCIRSVPFACLSYLLCMLPYFMLGKTVADLYGIYTFQSGEYTSLTLGAANLYAWIPDSLFLLMKNTGIYIAAGVIGLVVTAAYLYGKEFSKQILTSFTLFVVLLSVFLFPSMHERYFYLVDIFAIIYAFYNPSKLYVTILLQIVSIITYFNVLTGTMNIALALLAFIPLFILSILGKEFISYLTVLTND